MMMANLIVLPMLSYLFFMTLTHASDNIQPFYYCIHYCSNKTSFTPNSIYASNLNHLLTNLSSQAMQGSNYFYRFKVEDKYDANTVYGSYLCRGDVNATICKDCVWWAIKNVSNCCPHEQTDKIIWYDKCMLRYSNRNFFNKIEVRPAYIMWNEKNVTDQGNFAKALAATMNLFVDEVETSAKKFLTKKFDLPTENRTIYNLMQCTPDLSGADCTVCLRDAIATLPIYTSGKQGGRVYNPSCKLRFEMFQFYNSTRPQLETAPTIIYSLLPPTPGKKISRVSVAIGVTTILVFLALCCRLLYYKIVRIKKHDGVTQQQNEGIESLQFELTTIEIATKKFCQDNKLGQGGFGEVYKGVLAEGQEIAVKRLSKNSWQGAEEFKTEVALVAKLQHRNLARLLGYCLGRGETILVYEFVPNKSLDYFLFDPNRQGLLDWPTRCKIIGGIARGILYLHEDSRLRVIHRDLKASNILLDADMNPKISDFGMARMVGIDQTQGNTRRIVGTYGYMAPEYAMEGLYSVKSDVFSFGVLLLEILSGRKNSGFRQTKSATSLLTYAWQLWNEGAGLELMDPSLKDLCPHNEFMRNVHIGLLCVQEDAYNRPNMSSVSLMLTTEAFNLPKPKRPAFSVGRFTSDQGQVLGVDGSSENGLSYSVFGPR